MDKYLSWRSLIVYFGGLTFDSNAPTRQLKLPNQIAAVRVAHKILQRHVVSNSLEKELENLLTNGELGGTLGCYRELMVQRDVTLDHLSKLKEEYHRDSFFLCLLKNPYIVPFAEFPVVKVIYYSLLVKQYLTSRVGKPRIRFC